MVILCIETFYIKLVKNVVKETKLIIHKQKKEKSCAKHTLWTIFHNTTRKLLRNCIFTFGKRTHLNKRFRKCIKQFQTYCK